MFETQRGLCAFQISVTNGHIQKIITVYEFFI